MNNQSQNITPLANAITKALAYTENGGAPNLENPSAGKSGEMKSIFQFEPDTWKQDSKEVFGKEMPLTPDNETYVVHSKVTKWIQEGKTASQIASMWNAGEGEQDAHTGKFSNGASSVGTNKEGVKFDVPDYANKVLDYAKQFYQPQQSQQPQQSVQGNGFMTSAATGSVPTGTKLGLLKSGGTFLGQHAGNKESS